MTTLHFLPTGCDVHFFVDEFVVNDGQDLKTIDDISAKIDKKNHAWITVAKASKTHRYDFETWLEKKITEGYREPSLKYPLRNSKEIIKFESSLSSNSNIETEESKNTSPNTHLSEPDSEKSLTPEYVNLLALSPVETETLVESSIMDERSSEKNTEKQNTTVLPELQSNLDSPGLDANIEKDEYPTTNPKPPVSTNRILAYGLPRPMTKLKIPVNLTCGDKVYIKVHDDTNETMVDALKHCFEKLPPHRVLIVALAQEISSDLISAVEEARNKRRPLVIDRKSQVDSSSSTEVREYELFIRKWQVDLEKTQDLIASSCVIAGFEWASVLMITNDNHKSQFYARNIVMRAMSRLVWLKTNSIADENENEAAVIAAENAAIAAPALYKAIVISILESEAIYLEGLSVMLQYMKAIKVTLSTVRIFLNS